MHYDIGNHLRLWQSAVRPRCAAVGCAIHAIAWRDVAADIGLAHTNVYHVRIGWRNRDSAHTRRRERCVAHIAPRIAAVIGLKNAPSCRSEVIRLLQIRMSGYCE